MMGMRDPVDSSEPIEVGLQEMDDDPQNRIMYIYSAYNKCAIVDKKNQVIIWGINFQGFKVREAEVMHRFKPEHPIV